MSRTDAKSYYEAGTGALSDRFTQLKSLISRAYIEAEHDSDAAYLILSKLIGVCSDVQNKEKV